MKRKMAIATAVLVITVGCSGADATNESEHEAQKAADGVTIENAAPAIQGSDLAAVLDFKNAANCHWSDAAEKIFEEDTVFGDDYVSRPGTVAVPGVNDPVTAKLSRPEKEYPEYVEVQLDFKGEWLGLQVVGLTDAFMEESGGVFSRGIRFDAPLAEVTAALAKAGFNVNADGTARSMAITAPEFEGANAVTLVDETGSETVFFCNQVYEGM